MNILTSNRSLAFSRLYYDHPQQLPSQLLSDEFRDKLAGLIKEPGFQKIMYNDPVNPIETYIVDDNTSEIDLDFSRPGNSNNKTDEQTLFTLMSKYKLNPRIVPQTDSTCNS